MDLTWPDLVIMDPASRLELSALFEASNQFPIIQLSTTGGWPGGSDEGLGKNCRLPSEVMLRGASIACALALRESHNDKKTQGMGLIRSDE